MPTGEFVVGRSSACHLALDDGLVSRRHAVFHVTEQGVEVEDLGSRNGVQVNGASIEGRTALKHLDRVVIGTQELLLVQVHRDEGRDRGSRPTLAGMTLDLPVLGDDRAREEQTVHRTESVLDRIADKALALGRYEEAERMLGRRLDEILADARASKRVSPERLFAATGYALKLAEGTGKAAWLDWVFAAHDATGQLLDADAIGRLHDLTRRIRYPGGKAFKQYLANLRRRADTLSPSERFLLQRLEGIARMVGA